MSVASLTSLLSYPQGRRSRRQSVPEALGASPSRPSLPGGAIPHEQVGGEGRGGEGEERGGERRGEEGRGGEGRGEERGS